jgi:hypothetical protein
MSRLGLNEDSIPPQMRLTPRSLKTFVNLFNSRSNSIKHLMWHPFRVRVQGASWVPAILAGL